MSNTPLQQALDNAVKELSIVERELDKEISECWVTNNKFKEEKIKKASWALVNAIQLIQTAKEKLK